MRLNQLMSMVLSGLALMATAAGNAAEFSRVVPESSAVEFTIQQMGVTMEGHFQRINGQLQFDTATPEQGRALIEVDLSSIQTGMSEADQEVQDRIWFNTSVHPVARFESSAIRALGDQRFEVSGTLSIKGVTVPVVVPADLRIEGQQAVLEGTFQIQRGDFAIGEGSWSSFDIVANEVQVRFSITAAE